MLLINACMCDVEFLGGSCFVKRKSSKESSIASTLLSLKGMPENKKNEGIMFGSVHIIITYIVIPSIMSHCPNNDNVGIKLPLKLNFANNIIIHKGIVGLCASVFVMIGNLIERKIKRNQMLNLVVLYYIFRLNAR